MSIFDQLGINLSNPGGYCGIDYVSTHTTGHDLHSFNPSNNQSLGTVRPCSEQDYERIVTHSQRIFKSWRELPAPKRGELMRQIGEELRRHKSALGSLISMEMGKIKEEGDGEVQEMIDMVDFAVGQSRMLYGKTMHSERPYHRMYEQWHPLGLVGVITAFNFPMAVWAWNAFLAAVCGNTVIWKPSSKVPLCAIAVQKICNRVLAASGYSGVFSLFIPPNRKISEAFCQDRRIPLISFTGSTEVGRHLNEVVAHRLGRTILELSGNNAILVDESANLDLAIPAILFGAVGTAGQRCTTTRRLFVHRDRKQELVARLVDAYRQISVGDPLDPQTLVGPLIDRDAVATFEQVMQQIHQANGRVLAGGNRFAGPGNFVEPTLVELPANSPLLQQETFAPILYIQDFETIEEAIALNNHSSHGLSSALFTQNLRHSELFLSAMGSDCGIANINIGTSGAEIGGAFGGEKETGGGREAGSDAWKGYMRRQTNTINWGKELPLSQGINFQLQNRTGDQ